MAKKGIPLVWPDIVLGSRAAGLTLTRWLCEELRKAILQGRLKRGTRLPGTREFARQYHVSRRTAIAAFEQLAAEGYLTPAHGSGTVVNEQLPEDLLEVPGSKPIRQAKRSPLVDVLPLFVRPAKPFRPIEPALTEFPIDLWSQVAARRLRRASTALLAGGDVAGYKPLRETLAAYLGSSRGVSCSADQIAIVSGVQQALDLIARLIIRSGDKVWIEDPGYPGAVDAFQRANAKLVPVKVDEKGFDPAVARNLTRRARATYVTPAHQFVLGVTMPLDRRLALLSLASEAGAYIIEDDYDSEFRFQGLPVPALQGLDRTESVIYTGTFNKVLFTSLRLGYIVAPPSLVDPLLRLRYQTDRFPPTMEQAILCDFMTEGHFGRHLRRMRELYAGRLGALRESVKRYLGGVVWIPEIEAGLNTPAYLKNGMTSLEGFEAAQAAGIECFPLSQFTLKRQDLHGLSLGFAAFNEREIKQGVQHLAAALSGPSGRDNTVRR